MPSENPLKGRVALVTGASGGIGQELCRRLAESSAKIAAAYGSSADAAKSLCEELVAAGASAQAFAADMSDPAAPAQLVRDVGSELGAVDLLIANHGRGRSAGYEQLQAADFDLTLAINLRAPFLLAQAALPGMRARRFGRIVFVSSTAAFRGGSLAPDYAASKAALHGLAHFLASRCAPDGVTVNVIAPGFVNTPMMPGTAEELGQRVPIGRVGTAREVADLTCAILENGYITSQVIGIDGGTYPR